MIVGVEQLGAFASQFLVVMGVATCVRLLLATLDCRSYLFHPVAIISSAAALPIVLVFEQPAPVAGVAHGVDGDFGGPGARGVIAGVAAWRTAVRLAWFY